MPETTESPVRRDLDGVYYRVLRSGQYVNRCFSDLTDSEQDKFMEEYDVEQLRRLCRYLSTCLRKVGDELDLCIDE